ncbi:hypothetical protein BOTBODRAFT_172512 [Botryobasidium botryosum FD-172 SS1]|uniref:Uncharacterized protein n=1 Tax=Botryobasidium botryosum (strain FD-172 SS1) TaxID=930990 RepID=A0A067MMZ0_BOTB1|nr:hypothetical protein BOTBODRAFT_172512 [Botryobasidium botryosum FD-172 SS1]
MDALRNMPVHLLTPDIALVIANRAIVDGLMNPSRRTVYHSQLHNMASQAVLTSPTSLHIFVINKFHTLHPPKLAFYYRPPTYVPASFADLEEHIPADHPICTFDLLREPIDMIYPSFISLCRPAGDTALLAHIASGHCKVGSYFNQMHIDKPDTPIACPCRTIAIQTVIHIILKCPIMAPLCHLLEDDDGEIDAATLFTSKLNLFLKWLKATHAFTCHFGKALGAVSPVPGRPSVVSLPGLSVVD